MLFSETRQKIYELDQVGAFIWCKLAQSASLEEIHQELGQLGIGERAAREFTWQAMNVWIDRGVLDLDWRMSADCAFSTVLGQRRISVPGCQSGSFATVDFAILCYGRQRRGAGGYCDRDNDARRSGVLPRE